jgi:hypothetical protein
MNECKYELWARANDIKDLILPEDDAKEKSLRCRNDDDDHDKQDMFWNISLFIYASR